MMLACVFPAASFASVLVGPSLVLALATLPQQNASDPSVPTALEQALSERACAGAQSSGMAGDDLHARCLGAQLQALRTDFGRDLSRLSPSQRRNLDSACSRFQTTHGREAYLDCLQTHLASLPARRNRVNLPVAAAGIVAAPIDASPEADPSPMDASLSSSLLSLRWAGVLLTALVGAAALGWLVARARRARHACRVCAVRVPSSCDLCPTCRHDAAEALRRAAIERAERQRAHELETHRPSVQAEEQQAPADQDAGFGQIQDAPLWEQTAYQCEDAVEQEDEGGQPQAEDSQLAQSTDCENVDSAFNPHAVLGLTRGADDEEVRAAFEEARLKYDPEQVAYLGTEVQDHFANKLRAAKRAYRMLAGEVGAPAPLPGGADLHQSH